MNPQPVTFTVARSFRFVLPLHHNWPLTNKNKLNQLHAVSRPQQGRQWEPNVKTFRSLIRLYNQIQNKIKQKKMFYYNLTKKFKNLTNVLPK